MAATSCYEQQALLKSLYFDKTRVTQTEGGFSTYEAPH